MKASLRWISLFSCLAGGAAFAGETDDSSGSFDHSVATVSNAFELTVGAGFTQGTGDISHFGANVADISGAGGTVEIKAAYRMTPNFAFGAYGTIAKFTKADLADGTDVYGATAGLYADWHFRPDRSIDPVISLSSGYRGMWLSPRVGENTSLAGWEIARLQVSGEYRVSPDIALGPVVGASINTFFAERAPGTDGWDDITSPRANFFFFSGVQGRFDISGDRSSNAPGQAESAQAKN